MPKISKAYDNGDTYYVFKNSIDLLKTYPETVFGGEFETEAEYREKEVQALIKNKRGWILWPMIKYSYNTVNLNLKNPAPAPPSLDNLLGTDDHPTPTGVFPILWNLRNLLLVRLSTGTLP